MNKEVLPLIIKYYNSEMRSHNLYLNLSATLAANGYQKFARFLENLANDKKNKHMPRTMNFLANLGEVALLSKEAGMCDETIVSFDTSDAKKLVLNMFEYVVKNERILQAEIHKIASEALRTQAFRTFAFIQWFITDAVKDISEVEDVIFKIKHPEIDLIESSVELDQD